MLVSELLLLFSEASPSPQIISRHNETGEVLEVAEMAAYICLEPKIYDLVKTFLFSSRYQRSHRRWSSGIKILCF